MTKLLNNIINKYTKEAPAQVNLKLPKLIKINKNVVILEST